MSLYDRRVSDAQAQIDKEYDDGARDEALNDEKFEQELAAAKVDVPEMMDEDSLESLSLYCAERGVDFSDWLEANYDNEPVRGYFIDGNTEYMDSAITELVSAYDLDLVELK